MSVVFSSCFSFISTFELQSRESFIFARIAIMSPLMVRKTASNCIKIISGKNLKAKIGTEKNFIEIKNRSIKKTLPE